MTVKKKERSYILQKVEGNGEFKHPIWRSKFRSVMNSEDYIYADGMLRGLVESLVRLNKEQSKKKII